MNLNKELKRCVTDYEIVTRMVDALIELEEVNKDLRNRIRKEQEGTRGGLLRWNKEKKIK